MTTTPVPTCTDDLLAEIASLKRWKSESIEVLDPVLDYARSLGITKPGESLTAALIKSHQDLSARLRAAEVDAARYRYLLIEAGRWVPMPDDSCQCEDCVEQAELVAAIDAAIQEASQ